jgi:hypothetical protein
MAFAQLTYREIMAKSRAMKSGERPAHRVPAVQDKVAEAREAAFRHGQAASENPKASCCRAWAAGLPWFKRCNETPEPIHRNVGHDAPKSVSKTEFRA